MFTHHKHATRLLRLLAPLTLMLVVAPWASAQRAPGQSASSPQQGNLPALGLYFAPGFPPANAYVALDPRTLADVSGAAVLKIGNGTGVPVVSGDGSTAAVEDGADIVVWDLRTGRERSRLALDGSREAMLAALSQDGTRLLLTSTPYSTVPRPTWLVVETATGKVLRTIAEGSTGPQGFLFDTVAWRMYRFYDSASSTAPPSIVATDLTTGEALGQTALPDVAGERAATEGQPAPEFIPGLALSPDGRQLAIVDAAQDSVTLVTTRPLQVDRSFTFGPRTSRWQRLTAFLPLWPRSAEAKGAGGTWRQATFAADGQHLYVFGARYSLDGMQVVEHNLGLAVVDLVNGAATEPILTDERIDRVLPAPAGQSVYVVSFAPEGVFPPSTLQLRRLGATSLAMQDERTFDQYGWLVLLPAVPNAQ